MRASQWTDKATISDALRNLTKTDSAVPTPSASHSNGCSVGNKPFAVTPMQRVYQAINALENSAADLLTRAEDIYKKGVFFKATPESTLRYELERAAHAVLNGDRSSKALDQMLAAGIALRASQAA